MFAKETYIARRAKLKQTIGSGRCYFWVTMSQA